MTKPEITWQDFEKIDIRVGTIITAIDFEKATQQKIKGSKLVEIDNVGHLPHIEVFDQFIKPVKEFLK